MSAQTLSCDRCDFCGHRLTTQFLGDRQPGAECGRIPHEGHTKEPHMVRFRGTAVVVTAVAVTTALLSGCDVLSIGAPGPAPSTGSATTAPAAEKTTTAATPEPSATPSNRPKAKPKPKPTPSETRPAALMAPGDKGEKVRGLQDRLKQIGWYAAAVTGSYGPVTTSGVRGFQAKRGIPVTGSVDQRTLDRLRNMTRTPTNAELYNKVPKPSASGLDPRCLTGRAICVSKRTNSLVWVVDGQPRLRMDVRFGSDRTPTREGSFRVGWKSRHHFSSLYDTSMPYAMFFSGGQAVHYSTDFAAHGYNGASHGCVNVRNLGGIQALFASARVGDKVIVYR